MDEEFNKRKALNEADSKIYEELLPLALGVLEELMLSPERKIGLEAARQVLDIVPETSTKKNVNAIVGETINFNLGKKDIKKIISSVEDVSGEVEDISVEKLEPFEESCSSDREGDTEC